MKFTDIYIDCTTIIKLNMLFYSQNRSEKFGDQVWFHITSELISLYPLLLVILDLDAGQEMQNFPSRVGTISNSTLLKSGQIKINKSVNPNWHEAGHFYPPCNFRVGFFQLNLYQKFPNFFGGEN